MIALGQFVIKLLWLPLHKNGHGLGDERSDTERDEDGDEDGADRIGDHPAEHLHQDRGDNHAHAAQGVGQNVQKNALQEEWPDFEVRK